MRLHLITFVFVFYITDCYCGIINDVRHSKVEKDNGKTKEGKAEDVVNYSGGWSEATVGVPENILSMHDLNEPLESSPSNKEKRCPRNHHVVGSIYNANSDAILGAKTPLNVRRRDLQSQVNKRLCETCLTHGPCKTVNKCDVCANWCTPQEMASVTETSINAVDTNAFVVGSAPKNNIKIEPTDDSTTLLGNRFGDIEVKNIKRVYTIATLKTGLLKEVICKILGIPDTSDIDTLVVWVTTKSNQPPNFAQDYKKQVTPNAERLTDELNQELSNTLKKKIQRQGGKVLTNEEIEQVIGRILANPRNNQNAATKSHDTERSTGNSIEDEILPPYPIDPNSIDLNMPPILNPGIIEDTPYINLGEKQPKGIVGIPTKTRIGLTEGEDSSPPNTKTPAFEDSIDKKNKDELKSETDTNENDTLGTSKLIKKIKEKKVQQQGGYKQHQQNYRADAEADEGPENTENKDGDEDGLKSETDNDENDTLGTSKLIKKIKEKKAQKQQGGYQQYQQNYRANSEIVEDPGIPQNIGNEEGIISELDPHQHLNEEHDSSQPIQSNNVKGTQTMQGTLQNNPQDLRPTVERDDNIIGASVNVQNNENEPTLVDYSHSHPSSQDQPEFKYKPVTSVDRKPQPISANQEKKIYYTDNAGAKQTGESLQNSNAPFIKNTKSLDPGLEEPAQSNKTSSDTLENIIGGPGVSSTERGENPALEVRTHKLKKKIKQKKGQGIVSPGHRSNEHVEIISPDYQSSEEDENVDFSSGDAEILVDREQVNNLDSQGHMPDDKGQQLSNEQSRVIVGDTQTEMATGNVDNFSKDPDALKDVEKLVQTIQKVTKEETDHRLLGEEQPENEPENNEQNNSALPAGSITTETEMIKSPQEKSNESVLGSEPTITEKVINTLKHVPEYVREKFDEIVHTVEGQEIEKHNNQPIVGSQPLESVLWDRDAQPSTFQISRQKDRKEQVGSSLTENKNSNISFTEIKNSQILPGSLNLDQSSAQNMANVPSEFPKTTFNGAPVINQNVLMKDGLVLGTPPQNIPDMDNRGEFSNEGVMLQQSSWSNALGKILTADEEPTEKNTSVIHSKDVYFIGNGIKLPLQMVRKNDGAVHLSVDLDKLCTCKNFSCPKNHTAIEATVGTILEKEAELKDQLAATNLDDTKPGDQQEEVDNNINFENMPLGMAGPNFKEEFETESSNSDPDDSLSIHRTGREIENSKWLEMKNNIAAPPNSDLEDVQLGKVNIFKRSVNQEELNNSNLKMAHDKIVSLFENTLINNTKNANSENEERIMGKQQFTTSTTRSDTIKRKSNANRKSITLNKSNVVSDPLVRAPDILYDETTPNYLQQLINKKLLDMRTKKSNVERKKQLKNNQVLLSQEKLKNLLNSIGSQVVYDDPKTTFGEAEDTIWEYILKQKPINDKLENLNSDFVVSPNLVYKSLIKDAEKIDKRHELFDEVTPIKNSPQFQGMEDFEKKLDKLNKYVDQYSRDGEKIIKKEAKTLLNTQLNAVVKQEVDIMNNILTWLRNVTVNKK